MSIKSDHWIRRMASEHGMIEPFEPGQVRSVDGQRIVSYGTSSYGYDVRCAREFKIFTNINSTIVDPKAFDEKSFVDVDSDVCIIPPNSFALARTVEYFFALDADGDPSTGRSVLFPGAPASAVAGAELAARVEVAFDEAPPSASAEVLIITSNEPRDISALAAVRRPVTRIKTVKRARRENRQAQR